MASLKKKRKKTFIQPQPLLLIYHYLLFTLLPSLTAKMKNVKLRRDFVISQPTDSFRYLDRVLSHLPYFCPSVFPGEVLPSASDAPPPQKKKQPKNQNKNQSHRIILKDVSIPKMHLKDR